MSAPPVPRRGLALLVVLVTLAVAGVSAAVLHRVASGAQRRVTSRRAASIAASAAEAGVRALLGTHPWVDAESLMVGDTVALHRRRAGAAWVELRGMRLSPIVWRLSGTAWFPDSGTPFAAWRRTTLDVRLDLPRVVPSAALTVADAAVVSGTGRISGSDTAHSILARYCVPGGGSVGIALPDSTRLLGSGLVTGTPAVLEDPRAALASTYLDFGAVTRAALVARALQRLPAGSVVTPAPALSGAGCDTLVATNWGEPGAMGPCARWAPLIHVAGSLELQGGRGQGILLVDGDLVLSGGAFFAGLVLIRDDLRTGPGGGRIQGAVLAADTSRGAGDESRVGDGGLVERASCVVQGVLARHAPFRPIRGRAWLPM